MATDVPKDKKGPDSLFGPNVGVISSGPAWTTLTEKKVLKDELTMDIVKGWIDKSKQPTQPTTTLQALVNLKRPTIRLSPLSADDTDDDKQGQQHGLEFEFDCDAPKCGIYVHVLLPPSHPDAPSTSATPADDSTTPPKLSKLLVFESVVDGGFANVLKLEEGAVLELGRFENTGKPTTTTTTTTASGEDPTANVVATTVNGTTTTTTNTTTTTTTRNPRRRLTHFFSSRRHNNPNVSVSGPALAVVDDSANPNSPGTNTDDQVKDSKNKDKDKDASNGIKVTIRLAALDEQGTELASPNEQVTYLCVERFGVKPVKSSTPVVTGGDSATATQEPAPAPATEGGDNKVEEEEEEDTRPWVVKVVKREATIGPHTFHLHEIYGLTSSSPSTHTHAPTAPLPSTHTYPPSTTTTTTQPLAHTPDANAAEDPDAPSECLLCLSSPREVVLLPCRHLVACKDCALNMVEFGAGGNIVQGTEDTATTTVTTGTGTGGVGATETGGATNGTGAGETATGTGTGTGTGAETTTTIQNPRRKRKAKGWFCPVCRQPYTSLLRITTNPPPLPVGKEGETDGEVDADADAEAHEEDGDNDPEGDGEGDITEVNAHTQHPLANSSVNANASSGGLPLPVTTNVHGANAAGVPVGVDANANPGSTGVGGGANTGASPSVNGASNTSGEGEGETSTSASASEGGGGGGLFTRPGFLRGLTGKSKNGNGNAGAGERDRDLESQL